MTTRDDLSGIRPSGRRSSGRARGSVVAAWRAVAVVLLLGSLALADGPVVHGVEYSITRLEGTDRKFFQPLAINASGQIVGQFYPARGSRDDEQIEAALREVDGRYIIIKVPGGRFATPSGINAKGQIVGTAVDEKWSFGFRREPDGTFVRLGAYPDRITIPKAIDDEGAILAMESTRTLDARYRIRWPDGRPRNLSGGLTTHYLGFNSKGQVIGDSTLSGTRYGILLDAEGKITTIEWPKTTLTEPKAINNRGVIVGVFLNADDAAFGLHRSFVRDEKGKLAAFDVPGARGTGVSGINDKGQIIGGCEHPDGGFGFLATPKAAPARP